MPRKLPVASGVVSMDRDTAGVLDGAEDERHLNDLVCHECGFRLDSLRKVAALWDDVSGDHLPDDTIPNNVQAPT